MQMMFMEDSLKQSDSTLIFSNHQALICILDFFNTSHLAQLYMNDGISILRFRFSGTSQTHSVGRAFSALPRPEELR